MRQRETHKLRHVITQLLDYVPEEVKSDPLVKELAGYSCKTRMHVVRLLAPRLDNESHTKNIDFSPAGICKRWRQTILTLCALLLGSRGLVNSDP
jgi:NTE family protein